MITYLDCAVLAARLQSQDPQGLGNNHPLLAVVGGRDPLEELEALKSCRPACSLVGNHTADGPVKNLGRCAMMKGARLLGVHNVTLVKEVVVAQLYAHKECWLSLSQAEPER